MVGESVVGESAVGESAGIPGVAGLFLFPQR